MEEIVSNCCSAPLWHTESDICSKMFRTLRPGKPGGGRTTHPSNQGKNRKNIKTNECNLKGY